MDALDALELDVARRLGGAWLSPRPDARDRQATITLMSAVAEVVTNQPKRSLTVVRLLFLPRPGTLARR